MVKLDYDANEGGETGYLTVTSPELSVQVSLVRTELARLAKVPQARWTERRSVLAGTCMGLDAQWTSIEPSGTVLMTLGGDPESSALAFVLTASDLADLVARNA